MIKRFTFLVLTAALVTGFLWFDDPVATGTWSLYPTALAFGGYDQAAGMINDEQLAHENRLRRLALDASETEIADLPTVEMTAVLGMRAAVHDGKLTIDDIRNPRTPRAFHAALSRAMPHKALEDLAVLAVVSMGPNHKVAWLGLGKYAGDWQTLVFAMTTGMRIDLVREGKVWRLSYLPLVRASAGEHDAVRATAPPGTPLDERKELLNRIFAYNDAARQRAIWSPIGERDE